MQPPPVAVGAADWRAVNHAADPLDPHAMARLEPGDERFPQRLLAAVERLVGIGAVAQRVGLGVAEQAGDRRRAVGGDVVDRVGRKATCAAFYSIAAVAIVGLFHTQTVAGQYFWHIATVFFFNCAIGATHVYASELFPTELRATGYGWTTNLFGRVTEVAIPVLIGALIPIMGISWGITWVAIGPIIGALLVMKYALETRGLSLEEVQERLDAGGGHHPSAKAGLA